MDNDKETEKKPDNDIVATEKSEVKEDKSEEKSASFEREDSAIVGRKVFFVYPHVVTKEEILDYLTSLEFEVYMIMDLTSIKRVLSKFQAPICYINIDSGKSEAGWLTTLVALTTDPELSTVDWGIITKNESLETRGHFFKVNKFEAGFWVLQKRGVETAQLIQKYLLAHNAMGRRKYVRASCADDSLAVLNVLVDDKQIDGKILDISSVGFSCVFNYDLGFPKNSVVKNIQLKLRGSLISTDCILFGIRETERKIYVFLFPKNIYSQFRQMVRNYMRVYLQSKIDEI